MGSRSLVQRAFFDKCANLAHLSNLPIAKGGGLG